MTESSDDSETTEVSTRDLYQLIQQVNDIEARLDRFDDAIHALQGRTKMLELSTHPNDGVTENHRAILRNARNKLVQREQAGVAMTATEIVTATGVSRRYAYDLMTSMAERFEFCHLRERREIPNRRDKPKALIVHTDGYESVIDFLLEQ